MLFANITDVMVPSEGDQSARAGVITELLTRFEHQYPLINYELVTTPRLLNAQALVLRGERIVKLFGGLAFHALLDRDAIAFALLHETGHHLAGGARLPWNPFLACECQADLWAREQAACWHLDLHKVFANLSLLLNRELAEPFHFTQKRSGLNECWWMDWQRRSQALLCGSSLGSDYVCPLNEVLLPPPAPQVEQGEP